MRISGAGAVVVGVRAGAPHRFADPRLRPGGLPGLCAWPAKKLLTWTDPAAPGLTPDQVLVQVSLYWFTGSAASSARLYLESIEPGDHAGRRLGLRRRGARPSRRWAARRYRDIRYWAEYDCGGHFRALEAPDLLVADLCAFFRPLR